MRKGHLRILEHDPSPGERLFSVSVVLRVLARLADAVSLVQYNVSESFDVVFVLVVNRLFAFEGNSLMPYEYVSDQHGGPWIGNLVNGRIVRMKNLYSLSLSLN